VRRRQQRREAAPLPTLVATGAKVGPNRQQLGWWSTVPLLVDLGFASAK
jgi:hypothetical protein